MLDPSVRDSAEYYRRRGTARRTLTLAPLTPSQDVTRYQAKLMPPPTFDLDRKDKIESLLAIHFRTLAFVATRGAIVMIQRIGVWLGTTSSIAKQRWRARSVTVPFARTPHRSRSAARSQDRHR
jgi:hypothetical protein